MLLSRKQLLHPHSYTNCYCFHALVYQARSRACITAAAAKTAEATSAVAAPPPKPGAPKQCARVLFVGGLPGAVDPDVLQQQLAAACSQWHPTRVEVSRLQFKSPPAQQHNQQGLSHTQQTAESPHSVIPVSLLVNVACKEGCLMQCLSTCAAVTQLAGSPVQLLQLAALGHTNTVLHAGQPE